MKSIFYPKPSSIPLLLLTLLLVLSTSTVNAATNMLTQWVPFKIKNNHIVIEVSVKKSVIEAVVDTGANMSAIHKGLAKKIGVKASRERIEVSGIGKTKQLPLSRKATIAVEGLFSKRLPLLIYNTKMNARFILGMDYLAHGILQIDYIHSRLRLATPGSFKFSPSTAIPLTQKGLSYYLDVSIDSVRPETKFLAAQGQDGRYAALAVRLIINKLTMSPDIKCEKGIALTHVSGC